MSGNIQLVNYSLKNTVMACLIAINFDGSYVLIYEAHFGRGNNLNIHNQHPWTEGNSHGVIHSRHQQQFSIICGQGLLMIAT